MAQITLTGRNRQELEQSFLANLGYLRRYAHVFFRQFANERQRLVTDFLESVWFLATRKLERGQAVTIYQRWVCQGVLAGHFHGDSGTLSNPAGRRRFKKGHNDSSVLHALEARLEAMNLQLDVKLAVAKLEPAERRVILLYLKGIGYEEITKRLHVNSRVITRARLAMAELLADYAS